MPRGKNNMQACDCGHCHGHHGKKSIIAGVLLLVVAWMWYMNYSWPAILAFVGILLVINGLILKFKGKYV